MKRNIMHLTHKIFSLVFTIILASNSLIAEEESMVGKEAPPVMLFKYQDDRYFKSKDFLGKEYVIYNFWATWCSPCLKEMPDLYKIMEKLDPDMFELVLINWLESKQLIREKFLSKFEDKHTILLDMYGIIYERLSGIELKEGAMPSLPLTVIVDKKGTIIYHEHGADVKKLKEFLVKLK